ncbi:MAG: glycosyltransferase [Saprospiraceae bacterium]
MRILILCPWYAPFIHPRAHRWTALAEHWAAQGHETHVICGKKRGEPAQGLRNGVWTHRAGFDSLKELIYFRVGEQKARGRLGVKPEERAGSGWMAWLYRTCWRSWAYPDDSALWLAPARRKALQLLRERPYDLLITVSLPFAPHLIGLDIRRRYATLRWIADMGDPFAIWPGLHNSHPRRSRRDEARVLREADCVTLTTPALARALETTYGSEAIRSVRVIPPLLHPAPSEQEAAQRTMAGSGHRERVLQLGYFGAFYKPIRTPDALLRYLDAARQAGQPCMLHLYGDVFPEFLPALRRRPDVAIHGLQPRAACRDAMRTMDLLLSVGNATPYQLPGKLVEYMAARRPVAHFMQHAEDPSPDFFGEGLYVFDGNASDEDNHKRWIALLEAVRSQSIPPPPPKDLRPYEVAAMAEAYLNA